MGGERDAAHEESSLRIASCDANGVAAVHETHPYDTGLRGRNRGRDERTERPRSQSTEAPRDNHLWSGTHRCWLEA